MYPMKRFLDIFLSSALLLVSLPILLTATLAVYIYDFHNPFYVSERVGIHNKNFKIIKLRSMSVSDGSPSYVSTAKDDIRITPVGKVIRRFKLDELSQFINVLFGSMSIVGPRAQTRKWGTDLYTQEELRLLSVRPGITDFASITFSDEDSILAGSPNPDLKYNQIIRPWKSRLSLFCIDHSSITFDLYLIILTFLSIFNRRLSFRLVSSYLFRSGVHELAKVASRKYSLVAFPPPGSTYIEDGSFYNILP